MWKLHMPSAMMSSTWLLERHICQSSLVFSTDERNQACCTMYIFKRIAIPVGLTHQPRCVTFVFGVYILNFKWWDRQWLSVNLLRVQWGVHMWHTWKSLSEGFTQEAFGTPPCVCAVQVVHSALSRVPSDEHTWARCAAGGLQVRGKLLRVMVREQSQGLHDLPYPTVALFPNVSYCTSRRECLEIGTGPGSCLLPLLVPLRLRVPQS